MIIRLLLLIICKTPNKRAKGERATSDLSVTRCAITLFELPNKRSRSRKGYKQQVIRYTKGYEGISKQVITRCIGGTSKQEYGLSRAREACLQ